jgi:hypothetical protein
MFKNVRIGVKLIVVGTPIMVVPVAVIALLAAGKTPSAGAAVRGEKIGKSGDART